VVWRKFDSQVYIEPFCCTQRTRNLCLVHNSPGTVNVEWQILKTFGIGSEFISSKKL
jgi:hypothetical protein